MMKTKLIPLFILTLTSFLCSSCASGSAPVPELQQPTDSSLNNTNRARIDRAEARRRLARARTLLRTKTTESKRYVNCLLAKLSLEDIPPGLPESQEAQKLLSEARVGIEHELNRARARDLIASASGFQDTPGIHRLPNGRIYNVTISESNGVTTYGYSGAISGDVMVKLGQVLLDSRQYH